VRLCRLRLSTVRSYFNCRHPAALPRTAGWGQQQTFDFLAPATKIAAICLPSIPQRRRSHFGSACGRFWGHRLRFEPDDNPMRRTAAPRPVRPPHVAAEAIGEALLPACNVKMRQAGVGRSGSHCSVSRVLNHLTLRFTADDFIQPTGGGKDVFVHIRGHRVNIPIIVPAAFCDLCPVSAPGCYHP
jgi:hypothetical protein